LDLRLTLTDMLASEMKLPNADNAVVEREKIVGYLLNSAHRYGTSKARFFAGFGFHPQKWEQLAQALSRDGQTHEVKLIKVKEHDCVVLTAHLPGESLEAGDVGTVIHIHKGGRAYEVEFTTLDGRTLTVATIESNQLRPVSRRDVAHVRELQTA
jgi:hypothetical protein